MNTEKLLKKIDELKYKFIIEQSRGEDPTRLYLDSVHANKLEWYLNKLYPMNFVHTPTQSFMMYSGMRVYPIHCVDEHVFVA